MMHENGYGNEDGNLLLDYIIADNKCTITGYRGEDEQICVIPDSIEGCEVTAIAKYAFHEHRELMQIHLPQKLTDIGAHAFYNCRNLRRIVISDALKDMGDGAFKNCEKVEEIEIIRKENNMRCLKALMEEMNQEMRVTIHYENGMAVVVFPYYLYEYEENTPGRIINQVTIGSGVHYRECISGDDIKYTQYDHIFEVEKNIDVNESGWKVAYWRMRYPYELSDTAREVYRQYLIEHYTMIADTMIEKEMYDELRGLLDITAKCREDVEATAELARTSGRVKAVGILMEYSRTRWKGKKKSYDFE